MKTFINPLFKTACLEGVSRSSFKQMLIDAGIDKQGVQSALLKYSPSRFCRGCGESVSDHSFDIWTGYWYGGHYPCHPECKAAGMKDEAFQCQLIDADCNDCKHFTRSAGRLGVCEKRKIPVVASANLCTGHECFEHRRAT